MDNLVQIAATKGITLTNNNGTWRAEFGTEHLLDTTMPSTIDKFLSECELVETDGFLHLRIGGFIHHRRAKSL